jgi:release factor glutamine methyltransferase
MPIYPPAEDSFLLARQVEKISRQILLKNKNARVLDMGTGSGIQAITALNSGILRKNILAVDVNPEAVKFVKRKGINARISDLFSKVSGKFDLIVFNPPYLPQDKWDKEKDTAGGKKGDETILEFLKKAGKYLAVDGKMLLLLSSLTPRRRILAEIRSQGQEYEKIGGQKVFFEELYVLLIHPCKKSSKSL